MFEKVNPMHPDRQEQGVHIHLPGWDRDNHTIMKISSHQKSPPSTLGEKALYLTLSEIVFTGRSISKDRPFLKYKRYLLHICDRIAMLVRK